MNSILLIYFILAFFLSSPALSRQQIISIDRNLNNIILFKEIEYSSEEAGDIEQLEAGNPDWKTMILDRPAGESVGSREGMIWFYKEIYIAEPVNENRELSISLINLGSGNEVYWDRRQLTEKIIHSSSEDRSSPHIIQLFRIPDGLAGPGSHSLHIKKLITGNDNLSGEFGISIGFYDYMLRSEMELQIEQRYFKIFFMAVLFSSAVFSLIMFFGFNRRVEYLFFGLFCLANSRLAYFLPFYTIERSIEASLAASAANLNYIIFGIANISLLLYMLTRFSFQRTHRLFSLMIVLSSVTVYLLPGKIFSESIHVIFNSVLFYLIALFALFRKKEHSLIILTGLVGMNILSYLGMAGYISNGYFIGIVFFVVCISVLFSKEIADQYRSHREAVLKTARLENELLKRNIQPHFILNTLTSLQEIVESDQNRASEFIQALGEEFQVFSRISGERLISISDEIKMCRAHLKIMEYRKGSEFELITSGIEGIEMIPPGIIHTLIENGTTHGYPGIKNGVFRIVKEVHQGKTRYTVFNDSDISDIDRNIEKGTGFRYIEARLEESFPGEWNLSCGCVDGGWEVIIEIHSSEAGK